MGAIASGGVRVLNTDVVDQLRIRPELIDAVAAREGAELARREAAYRDGRPAPNVRGKTVILVVDGLATGASMQAGRAALRDLGPARVVAAVPVGAAETCTELGALADEVVCAATPDPFYAVGSWYLDFDQTTDEEVRDLLVEAERRTHATSPA